MKNGIVSLRLFTAIDRIANEAKITDGELAKASGMKYAARVAELRWMAKLEASGEPSEKVGRAFSVNKVAALIGGLRKIMGGDMLNRQLLKHSADSKTKLEKVLFKVLAIAGEEVDLDQLDAICETMIRASLSREKNPKTDKPKK